MVSGIEASAISRRQGRRTTRHDSGRQVLSCRCGRLRGRVEPVRPSNHLVCYCRDCQAFAHFLGRADDILDERGGTTVVQTVPAHVVFTDGLAELACMRLSPRGLLRWYARCCRTAIGCTPVNPKVSLISLISDCLPGERGFGQGLESSFGPIRLRHAIRDAREPVPGPHGALLPVVLKMMAIIARGRVGGRWRQTPFFDASARAPVASPRVLSRGERSAIMHPE